MASLQHAAASRDSSTWWRRHQARLAPAILLAPGCLFFATFVIYPLAASLSLSLFDWDGAGAKTFVGFDNYRELFADPVFHIALKNNFIWLAFNMLAPLLGLLLALFLNQSVTSIRVARTLFFIPFVISQAVVGLIFSWFLNPQFGLLNHVLTWLGLPSVQPLESENLAIFGVILAGLWPQTAYCLILFVTGLATLDNGLIESARVAGGKGYSLLWHIVLPQLRAIIFVTIMVCFVSALRSFDLVVIMTGGGPYDSSNVLAHYMFEQTFISSRFGYAAAIAAVLFALMGASVGFSLWQLLRKEHT